MSKNPFKRPKKEVIIEYRSLSDARRKKDEPIKATRCNESLMREMGNIALIFSKFRHKP